MYSNDVSNLKEGIESITNTNGKTTLRVERNYVIYPFLELTIL